MGSDFIQIYGLDLSKLLGLLAMCSARTLVALTLLPLFVNHMVPGPVRGAVALATVFPVAMSYLSGPMPVEMAFWPLITFIVKEAAVGLIIGWGFGAFFAGLQTVGEIIDHQTGLTFTQNIDPVHGNNISIMAHFLERVLFAALLSAGALLVIIDTLYLSYEIWPMGQWMPNFERSMTLIFVSQAGQLFALSLLLSGPMLLVLFVIDTGMGFLNRASPQLSIYNLTLSLKSLVGLMVLMLALPLITTRTLAAVHEVAMSLNAFLRQLR
jgi:type III secretion protein T